LKEKGLWTADDDIRQAYNIRKVNQYIDGYADAMKQAEANGITIDAENADWQAFWASYKTDNNIEPFHIIRGVNDMK